MAILIIDGYRVFCADKSVSLQHFIDKQINFENPDNAQPIRLIKRKYNEK